MFIAGADLKEFVAWLDAPKAEIASYCRRGQQLFGRLAKQQLCHGRGDRRHVRRRRGRTGHVVRPPDLHDNEKTAYGFPEVKLGLFPGWGGTARTPRMVGLSNAVELVTGGENIDPRAAAAHGLGERRGEHTGRRRATHCLPPRFA